jgi:hypothetical protein
MISALLSRGAVVKDYILLTVEARNEFLIRCAQDYFDIDSKVER